MLARPILGTSGEVLLHAGVRMKPAYIKRLEKLGISGAYVDDPVSEDLEVVGALSDELKTKAVKSIASIFSNVEKNRVNPESKGVEIMRTAEQIVDEILNHGDVMLNLFDMKVFDAYTYFHSVSVTVLSVVMGIGLGFGRMGLIYLAYAGLLHDIGKVLISPEIINKKGPLTPEEYDIVKKHPRDGYDYVKERFKTSISEPSARGILDHHERIKGQGYPDGKTEREISDIGKIIAIADVYDALVSDRPYRKGVFPVEAMEYIQGAAGEDFDLDVVQVFSRKVALFPVGSCVLLSDGSIALVLENFEGMTQRPRVKVFMRDETEIEPYYINLSKEAFHLTIIASVDI